MKKGIIGTLIFICFSTAFSVQHIYSQEKPVSERMAESIMMMNEPEFKSWNYVSGTVLRGFEEVWRVTNNDLYYYYILQNVNNSVNANGTISPYNISDYNIDQIKKGCAVNLIYKMTSDQRYAPAISTLRMQLEDQPRTLSGGFWHKKRYPWQMWLDGLYMGSPFYAEYGAMFNDTIALDDVVHQLVEMEYRARDPESGLLYHGWDESKTQDWADPETGLSESFWGRAMGWYAMALVDVLDYLPEDHAGRDEVIGIMQRLAEAIKQSQDTASHVWWQVLDYPGRENNYEESSVSCMFVYALAKSVRLGYIDESYLETALDGYAGILDRFVSENANGSLNLDYTCITAGLGNGRDGSYAYYTEECPWRSNDGKGLGPFLTASVEIEHINKIYPPGNLFIREMDSTSLTLTWKDNSLKDEEIIIERKSGGDFQEIAKINSAYSSYTDSTFTISDEHTYRIRACNATDTSVYSNQVSSNLFVPHAIPSKATNPAPINQAENVENPMVVLSWDTDLHTRGNRLFFGTTNPPVFKANLEENTFPLHDLEPGTTYFWRVNTQNFLGMTEGEVWSFTTDTTGTATSIDDKLFLTQVVRACPNPFSDRFIIQTKDGSHFSGSYTVYDQAGVRFSSGPIQGEKTTVDLSNSDAGVYILSITSLDNRQHRSLKLIKK